MKIGSDPRRQTSALAVVITLVCFGLVGITPGLTEPLAHFDAWWVGLALG